MIIFGDGMGDTAMDVTVGLVTEGMIGTGLETAEPGEGGGTDIVRV